MQSVEYPARLKYDTADANVQQLWSIVYRMCGEINDIVTALQLQDNSSEVSSLKSTLSSLQSSVSALQSRVSTLEGG